MLKAFNLLDIFWDYDIIVTIDMPSLGYYSALGLYSAGKSTLVILLIKYLNLQRLVQRSGPNVGTRGVGV